MIKQSAPRKSKSPDLRGTIENWGDFSIPHLGNRRVRVFCPNDSAQVRSALFLFDGQNVFDDHGSFAGGWHAHIAASRIGTKKKPVPVVVAIDHGHHDRIHELSPFREARSRGQLNALLNWLVSHLAPSVRTRFSIGTHPSQMVIGGSSMGGLAALYAHFHAPQTFGGALCMSPSLWFAQRQIFDYIRQQQPPWTSKIYLDAGIFEAKGAMVQMAQAMAEELRRRGYDDAKLWYKVDKRGAHNEKAWRKRLGPALRFFFR